MLDTKHHKTVSTPSKLIIFLKACWAAEYLILWTGPAPGAGQEDRDLDGELSSCHWATWQRPTCNFEAGGGGGAGLVRALC